MVMAHTPSVSSAFRHAPREWFLPPDVRAWADVDSPLPLPHGQTNSQPTTVATMLTLLDVRPGQRVLDVGSGSGWTTALLAELTGPSGVVLGVERVPDLVVASRQSVALGDWPWASIHQATPGTLGLPEQGPFDRILVSAEARALPPSLVAQLADDGVLVAPVAGTMTRVHRAAGGDVTTTHGAYLFVPLIED